MAGMGIDAPKLPRPVTPQSATPEQMIARAQGRGINPAPTNIYDPSLYNIKFDPTRANLQSENQFSSDPHVRAAQADINQYWAGNARGENIRYHMPGVMKEYENQANKVAQKLALATDITNAPKNLDTELGLLRNEAGAAIDQGVNKTRKNYNNRGLLYSGLRQGGEQQVRGRVASGLAQAQTSARNDAENLMTNRKAAFASIGLAEEEKKNQLAQQAFETDYQNSIARRQALQQLGSGLGQAAGYYIGSGSGAKNPATQINPNMENMSISDPNQQFNVSSSGSYAQQPRVARAPMNGGF